VEAITKISTEVDRKGEKTGFARHFSLNSDKAKIQHSAVVMANELNAVAIICFTRSGNMAKGVSALRPERSPIFAFSNSHDTIKQLRMHHGVIPFEMIFCTEPDATVSRAMKHLKKMGYLIPGDKIVVVSDILASDSVIDSIQLRTVSAD
jgi:pyruvate kinase